MMWMSSKRPHLSRMSLHYGDDGMEMGNERYALFWSAYEKWVMERSTKRKRKDSDVLSSNARGDDDHDD